MSAFPPIEELILHRDGLRLIDRVVAHQDGSLRAEAVIRADTPFFAVGRGMPAYVGFELMAQSISALDGLNRRAEGLAPVIGFLIGCRSYSAARPYFSEGERVGVEVDRVLGEKEGMASFSCRIVDDHGGELAKAMVNVYRPSDPDSFLAAADD